MIDAFRFTGKLATRTRAKSWSAVAERGTSADTAFGGYFSEGCLRFPFAIPSKGGVALSLPAALQGGARVSGSSLENCAIAKNREVGTPKSEI